MSKNREREGVQGPSPAPPPKTPTRTSPQCDPDTQVVQSFLDTEHYVGKDMSHLSSS